MNRSLTWIQLLQDDSKQGIYEANEVSLKLAIESVNEQCPAVLCAKFTDIRRSCKLLQSALNRTIDS